MLIIYTGNGKGKTTAAFGLALRAAGWGKKVLILQFVKQESWPEGARRIIRSSDSIGHLITIQALGSGFVGIMGDTKPTSEHKNAANAAIKEATKAISSKKYDLIILDEILGALHGKLISRRDVNLILQRCNQNSATAENWLQPDLVLTGRNAPKWLIDKADLVTEMKEVKHPFRKGIPAKKGVDY